MSHSSRQFKSLSYALIILLCIMINTVSVHAADSLVVGVSPLEPWKMEINGQVTGADIDIIKAIGKKENLIPAFQVAPFKRCLEKMASGEIDIMTGLLRKPEREVYIDYIEPPYKTRSNKVFYVRKGERDRIIHHSDLRGLKIGVKIGARYYPEFDKDKQLNKIEVGSYQQNIKKLITGRIDAMIITESQGEYLVRKLGLDDKVEQAAFKYDKRNSVYIGISKHSPRIKDIDSLKKAIGGMISSGETDSIIESYFSRNKLHVPRFRQ